MDPSQVNNYLNHPFGIIANQSPTKRIKLCLQIALDKSKQRNFVPTVHCCGDRKHDIRTGVNWTASDNMNGQQIIATQNKIIHHGANIMQGLTRDWYCSVHNLVLLYCDCSTFVTL
eukprot:139637_1